MSAASDAELLRRHRERIDVLVEALGEIEDIASDNVDLDAHAWNSVWHICQTAASRRYRAEAEVPSQESP